ncbi:hypothetical protein [Spirillospora sp. NPDC047279]
MLIQTQLGRLMATLYLGVADVTVAVHSKQLKQVVGAIKPAAGH